MNHLMSQEESYADRRKLFKNIWGTSMDVDEKDNISSKPKVIKTLRLDDIDRCLVGKKKKKRIKKLRTVCDKLLNFCDRKGADEKYEQMVVQGKEPPLHIVELRLCKKKTTKAKKKIRKAKTMHPTINATVLTKAAKASESKDDLNEASASISRNVSNIKINETSIAFSSKRYFTPEGTTILARKSHSKIFKKNCNKKNKSSNLQNTI